MSEVLQQKHLVEALQEKCLVQTNFEDYLAAVPLPPAVPTNWKPGFFSTDKPWGSLDEAVALLAGGKVPEGRELLRRLAKHTTDPAAKAVLAHELIRPPEDSKLSWSYLTQLPPDSSEFSAIRAIRALGNCDYDKGAEFFLKATDAQPGSAYGCIFLFEAYLYSSDLQFQTRLLLPRKRQIEGVFVTSALKGVAQLTQRRHKDAWTTFKFGWLQAEERAKNYEASLKLEMTAEEHKFIAVTASEMCAAGMGLVLFDLGLRHDAADVFAAVAPELAETLQYAAQVLAHA